ncbi:hypothetical protein EDC96DRAFT_40943 [Choanephora cucurbitarum]|nr:hypothetical protein EDC96DRAFT_40943 [Choanephora cucurbitarum]
MWSLFRQRHNEKRKGNSKIISIQLLEPIVLIEPSIQTCPVIRGTVQVSLPEQFHLERLMLSFRGHLAYRSNQIEHSYILTSQSIQLSPSGNKEHIQKNKRRKYIRQHSFEMPLPANLPESVCHSQIKVSYQLMAYLDYYDDTQHRRHDVIQHTIKLIRLPNLERQTIMHDEDRLTLIAHRTKEWRCHIWVDKTAVTLGSELPMHIAILIHPSISKRGARVKHIFVQLVEQAVIEEEQISQSVHPLHPVREWPLSAAVSGYQGHHFWQASNQYKIPNEKTISHSTYAYQHFQIRHILFISFVISYNHQREDRTMSYKTPIDLLDSRSVFDALPPYDMPTSTKEIKLLSQHGLISHNLDSSTSLFISS